MYDDLLPPRLDPNEAPPGYYAALKDDAKPKDGGNICRACDWRPECQKPETDFTRHEHRCMSYTVISAQDGRELKRNDRCSVVFKRLPANNQVQAASAACGDRSPGTPG